MSIEALRAIDVTQTVSWIGGSQLIKACAERTGLPTLNIGRQLASQLFDYNREGAWNGHIPVTAVNSAILVFAAVVLGVDQVVFSNERSASYGSLIEGTGEVNHQWSKGWAFEQAFAAHVRSHVAADLHYYSLLRPLSELAVARQFAKVDHYDAHFSSCNRNFHLLGERPVNRWCGILRHRLWCDGPLGGARRRHRRGHAHHVRRRDGRHWRGTGNRGASAAPGAPVTTTVAAAAARTTWAPTRTTRPGSRPATARS